MEHCGYLRLAQIIRAIADVLIITGTLPNGAIASHLSTNSSDSAAPPCISFTRTPRQDLQLVAAPQAKNNHDVSRDEQRTTQTLQPVHLSDSSIQWARRHLAISGNIQISKSWPSSCMGTYFQEMHNLVDHVPGCHLYQVLLKAFL